ncbi:hypothetical protein ABB27_18445 [Stenotrophomonas terrae]|uniref:Fimbrial protein n=1 Tax=Stenotrophomonas terrae TaxID=405446 RepID=A0A0R0BYI8_9GAMM|nr:fimbria/pilus outer membrane usher protein [Stenotrophomonas terrae]KRG62262.1 hypothetical protein ABB27_18445 [Stenotrophomonas terrae]
MLRTIRATLRRDSLVPRLAPLAVALNTLGIGSAVAAPQFNLDFLRGAQSEDDVAMLSNPGSVLPGTYLFSVYLNGDEVAREQIPFERLPSGEVQPCLSSANLQSWNIRVPSHDQAVDAQPSCEVVPSLLPGSKLSYNGNQQRLDLQVPQVHLQTLPRGYIRRSLRDQGINAMLLEYAITGSHDRQDHAGTSDYLFASINSGLNLGMWRLRHSANLNRTSSERSAANRTQWHSRSLRAETDLGSQRSRLVLGDTYTSYGVFDSVRFRGARLANDDDMLAFSQRSYAPVVRGMAASGGRVEVRQDGQLIHSINVAPGPFEIKDIVPSRMSGELEVSVIGADGSLQRHRQAFSAVETMLRPGLTHYEFNAGTLRNGEERYQPRFVQATLARGLRSSATPYGGVLLAENYQSIAFGVAHDLGSFGSASIDISHARTQLAAGGSRSGQSYRFLYSKSLNTHGTEFRLVGHRYSTSGYYDLSDAANEREQWRNDHYESWDHDLDTDDSRPPGLPDERPPARQLITSARYQNKRNHLEVAVDQRILDDYSLNLSYNSQNYWGSDTSERNLHLGFNGRLGRANYSLFFRDTRARRGGSDRSLGLSVTVPLGRKRAARANASTAYSHSLRTGANYQTGINGTALHGEKLGYGLNLGRSERGGSAAFNANYTGSKGYLSFGATQARDYQQLNWGASGAWVVHAGGLTLAQSLQSSNVLVHATDGAGIGLENRTGVRLDRRGYGVISGVAAYRNNRVALRSDDLGGDIDASRINGTVVPTRGALVRMHFDTRRGNNLMIHSRLSNGKRVPMGAGVFDKQGHKRGVAGPDGALFVSGVRADDSLSVRWGQETYQACELHLASLRLPATTSKHQGYRNVDLQCTQSAALPRDRP